MLILIRWDGKIGVEAAVATLNNLSLNFLHLSLYFLLQKKACSAWMMRLIIV